MRPIESQPSAAALVMLTTPLLISSSIVTRSPSSGFVSLPAPRVMRAPVSHGHRGRAPQTADDSRERCEERVDRRLRGLSADGDAKRTLRELTVETEREQYRGWLGLARGARGPARHREALEVQPHDERLAFRSRDAERGVVRKAPCRMTREHRIFDATCDAGNDPVAEPRLAPRLARLPLARDAHRDAEADHTGDVLGSGATTLLLSAAGLGRGDASAAPNVERADALRSIELVGVDRYEVDRDLSHVEGEGADALHRVAVEGHPAFAADLADRLDRLDRSDLVVRVHHRDQRGLLVHRFSDRLGVDEAVPIDADHRQTRLAVRRKIPCGIDHRVVLDRGGDEPVAAVLDLEPAAEREIVGLSASAGEDDLAGMGTDRVCDLLARAVHEGSRCPSLGVDARRIAVRLAKHAGHRLGDFRVDGGRRGVVEIHTLHRSKSRPRHSLCRLQSFGFAMTRSPRSSSSLGSASAGASSIGSQPVCVFGKAMVSRAFASPARTIRVRSIPVAIPPSGGAPYSSASRSALKRSAASFFEMPRISNTRSCIARLWMRMLPPPSSAPSMTRSYCELSALPGSL